MTRDELLFSICPGYRTPGCCNGDKSFNCDDCNRVLGEWLDKYDKHVIEQYKANTNLKDTIKDIHDNVAQEMYNKAIDDFVHKCDKYCGFYSGKNKSITREDILKIAEQLKEQK